MLIGVAIFCFLMGWVIGCWMGAKIRHMFEEIIEEEQG